MYKDFTVVRKGYDPDEVDTYIDSLMKEINAYKTKEQAINQAIVSAQLISDQLVAKAKEKAAEIEKEAKARLSIMQKMLDETEQKLTLFQGEYNKLIAKYLIKFNEKEMKSLIDELHSIRDSFVMENVKDPNPYEGTQAHNLSQKVKNESSGKISKEEMNSLFNNKK